MDPLWIFGSCHRCRSRYPLALFDSLSQRENGHRNAVEEARGRRASLSSVDRNPHRQNPYCSERSKTLSLMRLHVFVSQLLFMVSVGKLLSAVVQGSRPRARYSC
ncbi:hypothetical protein BDV26DRAFT_54342 [Aspergillus bertholletiae]|uniref:Uncharacterized protein n=1 Tax=Aspergillus bertholletiae TaxID=1226010 RepID=A0A5N7AX56_9EURO|nr:hypothetical protein BDV26DRAFT_54342 [Aspergillus bertholletiae]